MNIDEIKKDRKKIVSAIEKNEALFVATPVHSDVSLYYMKSCLDLQKECLLNKANITFQLMKSSICFI